MNSRPIISIHSRSLARCSLRADAGFSLLEIFVTIALIGVIAAVAINSLGSAASASVRDSKLSTDVQKLNQLVALYRADGGSLAGISTEQGVLDKLKRSRSRAQQNSNVHTSSGRLIDVRLRALAGSGTMPAGQTYRAKWQVDLADPNKSRFVLSTGGAAGADEFYLDDSLTEASFPLDTRTVSAKQYNGTTGWVWGSNAADVAIGGVTSDNTTTVGTSNTFNPGADLASASGSGSGAGSGSGSGSGTGAGSGAGSGSGTGPGPIATPLPNPVITPLGGTYSTASFPGTVTINSNGAPGGASSALRYRVNGGSWMAVIGAVSVSSGDRIEAMNIASSALYSDSGINAQEYYRLVADFSGSGSGTWNTIAGGSALKYTISPGDPTASISHGETVLDLGGGNVFDSGLPNTLTYTKNNFSTVSPNTAFTLGTLNMLNGTTYYDSEATSATLTLNLTFSNPPLTRSVDIRFNLINTDNSTDRLASADIVELATPSPMSVTIDGVTYTMNLQWVTLDPGSGVVQGNQFLIFEGANARAELRATLVSNH